MDNRTRVVVALADMTYPERRSFDHPNKYGYDLTATSIPDTWNDVMVQQFRIDARNNFTMKDSETVSVAERAQGLTISGK